MLQEGNFPTVFDVLSFDVPVVANVFIDQVRVNLDILFEKMRNNI